MTNLDNEWPENMKFIPDFVRMQPGPYLEVRVNGQGGFPKTCPIIVTPESWWKIPCDPMSVPYNPDAEQAKLIVRRCYLQVFLEFVFGKNWERSVMEQNILGLEKIIMIHYFQTELADEIKEMAEDQRRQGL